MTFGALCAPNPCFSRYRFTGKERDTESGTGISGTGNDYFGARYYASSMGRFMSPDPSKLSYNDPTNPQGFNLFNYALNNPLAYIDPTGLTCQTNDNGDVYDDEDGKGCAIIDQQNALNPGLEIFNYDFSSNVSTASNTSNGAIHGAAPSKPVVLPNPCPYQGRALSPSGYAQAGQAANGSPVNFTLDVTMGFPAGDYLDPQPLASGNVFQNQAYGNYTFGVYMASAGVSLPTALSGANAYAFVRASYPASTQMDQKYGSLPAANVANITNGYNAQMNGTVCHN